MGITVEEQCGLTADSTSEVNIPMQGVTRR